MQVVMNKCFLLNPEKNLVRENAKNTFISENDVSEPKAKG